MLDRLYSVTLALVAELAVTRARLDTVERLLDRRSVVGTEEIEAYVAAEPAYDCAGGFKCEGLGISLLDRLDTEDPTALIGLPLVSVSRALRAWTR